MTKQVNEATSSAQTISEMCSFSQSGGSLIVNCLFGIDVTLALQLHNNWRASSVPSQQVTQPLTWSRIDEGSDWQDTNKDKWKSVRTGRVPTKADGTGSYAPCVFISTMVVFVWRCVLLFVSGFTHNAFLQNTDENLIKSLFASCSSMFSYFLTLSGRKCPTLRTAVKTMRTNQTSKVRKQKQRAQTPHRHKWPRQ